MNKGTTVDSSDDAAKHESFIFEYISAEFDRERERLNRFREKVSFVTGFALLLGTGITSIISSYVPSLVEFSLRDRVFIFGMSCTIIMFGICVYYLARCILPVLWIGNAHDPLETWKSYQAWVTYSADPQVKDPPDLERMFRSSLTEQLAKAASHNRKSTETRSQQLQAALQIGFIAALILIAPTICLLLKHYSDPKDGPIRVEIVNPATLKKHE